MGDPLGSFPKERVSEDKARCKDPCWFVGTVVYLEGPLQLVSEPTSHNTMRFGDEPCGSWWACNIPKSISQRVNAGA